MVTPRLQKKREQISTWKKDLAPVKQNDKWTNHIRSDLNIMRKSKFQIELLVTETFQDTYKYRLVTYYTTQ
jgi:uncharacterized protein YeaO (DUF488 family)